MDAGGGRQTHGTKDGRRSAGLPLGNRTESTGGGIQPWKVLPHGGARRGNRLGDLRNSQRRKRTPSGRVRTPPDAASHARAAIPAFAFPASVAHDCALTITEPPN